MPRRSPVVNGIFNLPAFSIVSIRASGTLPGEFLCAGRRAVVSSMRPMLAFTGLARAGLVKVKNPGICMGQQSGHDTFPAKGIAVFKYGFKTYFPDILPESRFILRFLPNVNKASVQPSVAPRLSISETVPGVMMQLSPTGVRKMQ